MELEEIGGPTLFASANGQLRLPLDRLRSERSLWPSVPPYGSLVRRALNRPHTHPYAATTSVLSVDLGLQSLAPDGESAQDHATPVYGNVHCLGNDTIREERF